MTTKHMPPTPEMVLEGTADLYMIMMLVLTRGPQEGPKGQLYDACVANDKRWMSGDKTSVQTLSCPYYRALTADCTFDI